MMRRCFFLPLICIAFMMIGPASYGQTQAALLNQAYKQGSDMLLRKFLDNWAKASAAPPKQGTAVMSAELKNVYSLFQEFYRPQDLHPLGGMGGVQAQGGITYLVMQQSLDYNIADSLPLYDEGGGNDFHALSYLMYQNTATIKTIRPFHPRVTIKGVKFLTLTPQYEKIIDDFSRNDPDQNPQYEESAQPRRNPHPRKDFLSRYITMKEAHWRNAWLYESYPVAKQILLDKAGSNALISYALNSKSGIAYYQKIAGTWKLTEARITISQ